ncbi:sugar transferase, partial [bacterium]|nr:sugar transferase [bacterium]
MAAKRFLDIVGSLAGLVLLSPVLLIIAAVILINMGRPILYRQKRPGFREKPFTIYKFRTMVEQRDAKGKLLSDEKRLTSVGRFLRSSSLDELPELWNVLRGEMSLVGPRPLLMQYLPRYDSEQKRRHDVKPGITGWAQIHGRNATSFEERFKLDVWYVDHWT